MKLVKLDDVLELIDRSADLESNYENSKLQEEIKRLPTVDAVPTDFHDKCMQIEIEKRFGMEEVVRCKECKYLEPSLNSEWCWCCYFDSKVKDDDFCSRGERKEDAEH